MPIYYPTPTEDLRLELIEWQKARQAITTGQNYSIEGVSLSRADLDQVNDTIDRLTRTLTDRNNAEQGNNVGITVPSWT